MQSLKKRPHKRRWPIVIISVAVLLAASAVAYAFTQEPSTNKQQGGGTSHTTDTTQTNLSPATDDEKQAGSDTKKDSIDNKTDSSSGDSNGQSFSVTLTASSQDSGVYHLRYLIQATLGSGTCTLTLTKGSTAVERSASVQASASTSTCQGFDIPTSQLSSGQWQASLNVTSGDQSGKTVDTITVQ